MLVMSRSGSDDYGGFVSLVIPLFFFYLCDFFLPCRLVL